MEIVLILTPIALMSLSWPPKVCLQAPSLMSHSLAVKSHAPEMKNLKSGDTARDMQSPWCPAKTVFWVPVSISHSTLKGDGPKTTFISVSTTEREVERCFLVQLIILRSYQVQSPELVMISLSLRKRQQDR